MADNEKLLEAARMIQEHCKHTERGKPCALAHGETCDGVNNCGVGKQFPGGCIPCEDWNIPKPCRWTENDLIMAKALIVSGFDRVAKKEGQDVIFALMENGDAWIVPPMLFKSLNASETVNLSDIIAEYEARR